MVKDTIERALSVFGIERDQLSPQQFSHLAALTGAGEAVRQGVTGMLQDEALLRDNIWVEGSTLLSRNGGRLYAVMQDGSFHTMRKPFEQRQTFAMNQLKTEGRTNVVGSIAEALALLQKGSIGLVHIVLEECSYKHQEISDALHRANLQNREIKAWSRGSLPGVTVHEIGRVDEIKV